MKRRARVAIAMSALAASSASSVHAQPSATDKALAIQAYEDGEKLMADGNAVAACNKYAESQRFDPQLGTLLHLADCHEKIGKLASAWAGFKEAAEIAARRNAAGNNEPREKVARDRAANLQPKLSVVVLHVAQANLAGLEIRRDGELVGRAVWGSTMLFDPGRYTFAAQAPGKKLWSETVDVRADGSKIDVRVPPLEDATLSTNPVTAPTASPVTDPSSRGSTQRTAGYIVTGLGVIGLGMSAFFGLKASSLKRDADNEANRLCPGDNCKTPADKATVEGIESDAQHNATAFNVAIALGGVATVAGLALVLTAPSSRSPSAPGVVKVVPWAGISGAGAAIAGSW